jgi:hypothetical protein
MSESQEMLAIRRELEYLFDAHEAVGLHGFMTLYTIAEEEPWRAVHQGLLHRFDRDGIADALGFLQQHYNDGKLPNTPLLLDPVIHDAAGKPLGSGVMWASVFSLGIHQLSDEAVTRLSELGLMHATFHRADNPSAGVKLLAAADRALAPEECAQLSKAMYDVADIEAPLYYPFYLLSGLRYLCLHGMFNQPGFEEMKASQPQQVIDPQKILNARQCWDAYDRTHSLYQKWGINPADIAHNNRFFDLCARDVMLFDATGPMRGGADERFEFLVPGLLPRGAITVLAAAGGCGKSSIAHELCIYCATDYEEGEEKPVWLGQPVNTDVADGICVYFSGEDGPAIINARAELYDPEGRAQRLQFHRADFGGDDVSFADFVMDRLMKMPKIPLVVVDPARKYLSGNEEDAEVVSEFFYALEELATHKNCAVVVVHHLKKGAKPQSIPEVLGELRGSQVFIDRARVVLGMFREGVHTIVGLAKNNIPPTLGMVTDERVFVRNPKTLKLLWLPGEEGVRRDTLSPAEIERLEAEAFKKQVEAAKAES